jgi:hypothetical protein
MWVTILGALQGSNVTPGRPPKPDLDIERQQDVE